MKAQMGFEDFIAGEKRVILLISTIGLGTLVLSLVLPGLVG